MTADTESPAHRLLKTRPSRSPDDHEHDAAPGATRLSPALTLLFSVACALAVANVYFHQPLLDSMADSLAVAPGLIGTVVTAIQVDYALGLLFIVPLGDLVNRRRLVLSLTVVSAVALAVAGVSQAWQSLLGALVVVGASAVVVQVLVAYVAVLASPSHRGRAVGTVTSGIVLGILLARLMSGLIADLAGWRAVYFVSSGLMLVLSAVLWKSLPDIPSSGPRCSYLELVRSLLMLLISEPVLRKRGMLALLSFAAFSVLWTAMVLPLSAPPLALSHTAIGLFGLAGVAGALAARRAGRWADQGLGQRVTGLALGLLMLSWLPTGFAEASLLALVLGVILLDFAVQAVHVTSQSLILADRPDAQSRMVGAYMFLFDRQRLGRSGGDAYLCALGLAGCQPAWRVDQRRRVHCVATYVSLLATPSRRAAVKIPHLLPAVSTTATWSLDLSVIKTAQPAKHRPTCVPGNCAHPSPSSRR